MQFIPGMGLDAVLDELRRLRRVGGSAIAPEGRNRSQAAVSAAAVAEAILTGRFSLTEPDIAEPVPNGATLTAAVTSAHPPGAPPAPAAPSVSLPGASADSLARSDPDRTFFRSVARIGLQVAEALEYANRQGVLHRDVKPSNLLLDPKGNVWVADFGLAKAADAEDITHSGDIVGTVRYLARERTGDGGARRLEAECDSLDGRLLHDAGRPAKGRSSLERARALYEGLIRDNPPYTLPTVADGPTEYRRGLAKALDRIGETYHDESRHDEVLRIMEELQAVSEELVSGRFANDTDRQRLGRNYQTTGWALTFFRLPAEAIQASERGLAIYRQFADANPSVTAYKIALASCLEQIGFIHLRRDVAKARRYALAAISVIRSLSAEQKVKAVIIETLCERIFGSYDLAGGRIDEALLHMRRSVSVIEGAARAHPDYLQYQEELGGALVWLAVTELIVGDAKGAVRTAGRIRDLVETILREYPELRLEDRGPAERGVCRRHGGPAERSVAARRACRGGVPDPEASAE
ncbi:MAG: protein kinase domain-containing protein [Isosphaeraceae bacterium]